MEEVEVAGKVEEHIQAEEGVQIAPPPPLPVPVSVSSTRAMQTRETLLRRVIVKLSKRGVERTLLSWWLSRARWRTEVNSFFLLSEV